MPLPKTLEWHVVATLVSPCLCEEKKKTIKKENTHLPDLHLMMSLNSSLVPPSAASPSDAMAVDKTQWPVSWIDGLQPQVSWRRVLQLLFQHLQAQWEIEREEGWCKTQTSNFWFQKDVKEGHRCCVWPGDNKHAGQLARGSDTQEGPDASRGGLLHVEEIENSCWWLQNGGSNKTAFATGCTL